MTVYRRSLPHDPLVALAALLALDGRALLGARAPWLRLVLPAMRAATDRAGAAMIGAGDIDERDADENEYLNARWLRVASERDLIAAGVCPACRKPEGRPDCDECNGTGKPRSPCELCGFRGEECDCAKRCAECGELPDVCQCAEVLP